MEFADAFGSLSNSITMSFQTIVFNAILLLPDIIAALVILTFGWAIGSLFAWVVKRILTGVRLEAYLKSHGLADALGKIQVTHILTQIVKYYIWLLFIQQAVLLIHLGAISDFINGVLGFAPGALSAIALVVSAAIFGEWVREKILETGKDTYLKTVARMTKYFIIFLGIITGLENVHLNVEIIKSIIETVLQGIVWGIALAFGIAFGLGGQDTAKDITHTFRKALHI